MNTLLTVEVLLLRIIKVARKSVEGNTRIPRGQLADIASRYQILAAEAA